MSLRLTSDTKQRLDAAAKLNDRPFSQEAELRIEQSFLKEDLLPDVLTLAYDDRLAGLVMAVGETIKFMGPLRLTSAHYAADGNVTVTIGRWDEDESARREASQAASKLLELIADPDSINEFEKNVEGGIQELGELPYAAVCLSLMALKNHPSRAGDKRWKTIRSLLGPPFSEAK